MLSVNIDEIPDELKALSQWVNWKSTNKVKIPVNPVTLKAAASTDSSTWSTFDHAKDNIKLKTIAEVGFCLTNSDEYVIIDIDHCIENGIVHDIAKFWIDMFDSYAEISPSGTGIHIFVKGDVSSLVGNGKKTNTKHSNSGLGFEIYHTARYFTVTGQPVHGLTECGAINNQCQNVLELFFHTYFKKGRKNKTWRPIDGAITDGNRNTTMQQTIGSLSSTIIHLIDDEDVESVLEDIVIHYNDEFFDPPLSDKELKAQLRSASKYLSNKQDEYADHVTDEDLDKDDEGAISEEEHDDENPVKASVRQLVERYVFIKSQNKFYDSKTGMLLVKESVDYAHGEKKFAMRIAGDMKAVPLTKFIMHSKSKNVADNITWKPNGDTIVMDGHAELFNTYRPIDTKHLPDSASDESIKMWIQLSKHVIPQPELREVFYDYLAFTLQYPEIKINYGIILCSDYEGIGKDLLLRPIVRLLGNQAKEIKTNTFLSQYDQYLNETKLLIIQEIFTPNFHDKRSIESALKPLLASPPDKLEINVKHDKLFFIDNVVNVIMTTNHDDAISIDSAEKTRRFLGIHTGSKPLKNEFYEEIANWFYSGGANLVCRWLLERDLSNFNFMRSPFNTDFLKKLEYNGQSTTYHRIQELYEEGIHPFDLEFIKTHDIKDALDDTKLSPRAIGLALKKLGYHNFGVESDEIKKKAYRVDDKTITFTGWADTKSKKFAEYAKLGGKELEELYIHRIKRNSSSIKPVRSDKFRKKA